MLNRRHLRVKVLQVLYAFHQSESKEVKLFEKSLLQSVDQVYEMYIWVLSLFIETADQVMIDAEERANKYLPSESDLNTNTRLNDNKFINALRINPDYLAGVKKYKVSWTFDPEVAKNILSALKGMSEYQDYLDQEDTSIRADKDIIKAIFKKIVLKNPAVEQIFEEKFINWPVDKEVLQAMVAKTFKNFSNENLKENKLAELCLNWQEDRQFIIDLLHKAINHDGTYQEIIAKKTKNWEADRIAMMDTLLMKLAMTEMMHFSSIPVKVTMNEYIEISKDFSTPKSNTFINGILDKILEELKESGKIKKFGRGLLE